MTLDPGPTRRHHFVLIPGFGAFDALGSIDYFFGIPSILRGAPASGPGREAPPVTVHAFPNEPTAAVATRSRYLREWLLRRMATGLIGLDEEVHLIGHSTGGLDIRQMLIDLDRTPQNRIDGIPFEKLLERIRSVQFLAAPHRGTNIATWINAHRIRYDLALGGLYELLRLLRPRGVHWTGKLIRRLVPRSKADGWVNAAIDTLYTCYHPEREPYPAALARTIYFDTMNWVLTMARDFTAILDLDPANPQSTCPAHHTEEKLKEEAAGLAARGIRVRSIATVAKPHPEAPTLDLFSVLHDIIAANPPERLQRSFTAPDFFTGEPRTCAPWENDGIANTVSMEWPGAHRNVLLEADHGDVIGHYTNEQPASIDVPEQSPTLRSSRTVMDGRHRDPPWDRRYDLLRAANPLDDHQFSRLWEGIREFAFHGSDEPPAAA